MKRLALAFVTMTLAFSFAGCGSAPGTDSPSVEMNNVQHVPVDGGSDIAIYDVTLNDGTRCVVARGYKSGGVSCDFNSGVTP